MSLEISFHEDAQAEFDEALAFYSMERVTLGGGFIQSVEHAVAQAQRHPESAAVIRGRARRMRVERFPYSGLDSVRSLSGSGARGVDQTGDLHDR